MSKEEIQALNGVMGWASRIVMISLLSVCVYFLKDLHTDFKATRAQVNNHEGRILVLESIKKSLYETY